MITSAYRYYTALLIAVISFFASLATPASAASRPNILVFIADDLGWRDIGPYGNTAVRTPNIDRLARSGIKLENAFLLSPQCSPSRIALLTGQYPHQTRTEDLHDPLPAGIRTVASYLSDAGYVTGLLEKGHLGPEGERQFDFYNPLLAGLDEFLDKAKGRPFFLWAASIDPHRPYGGEPGPSGKNGAAPRVHRPQDVRVPPQLIDDDETRDDIALYYDEIARFDAFIGDTIKKLERRGLARETLLLFLSDNGAPFPREKGALYDAGIKTPFIAVFPGEIAPNSSFEPPVSMINLAPTILDFAGMARPPEMQGVSARSILSGQSLTGDEYVFANRDWHNTHEHQRMVRNARYKLIWTGAHTELPMGVASDLGESASWFSLLRARRAERLTPEQSLLFTVPRPSIELYDIKSDPLEFRNLAFEPEYARVAREMSGILMAWRTRTGDHEPTDRVRSDNVDRVTGIKFRNDTPPLRSALSSKN